MAWTQDDIDRLRAAIASGIQTVSYDGPPRRTITYHSMSDMRSLLGEMSRAVTAETSASPPLSFRRVVWSKGFDRGGRRSFRRNE